MDTHKAVNETRLRLRIAMKRLVADQTGASENIRIGVVAEAIGWKPSSVRKAMGRQASPPNWLPQGAALVRFTHVADISAEWLFTGFDQPSPLTAQLADHVAAELQRKSKYAIPRSAYAVDGTRALQVLIAAAFEQFELMQAQYSERVAQAALEKAAPPSHKAWATMARKLRRQREAREVARLPLGGIVIQRDMIDPKAPDHHWFADVAPKP